MAEDQVSTEYGIQLPDGTQRWTDDTRGELRHSPAEIASSRKAFDAWKSDMRTMAGNVGLDPDWFIAQHRLIARDKVTSTSEIYPVTPASVNPGTKPAPTKPTEGTV